MSDILDRRRTHFVLWCPTDPANAPALVIGRIRNGNPARFEELTTQTFQRATNAAGPINGPWQLAASSIGLSDGETYHYWFEVDNSYPGSAGRIQVTDPLAFCVDYRLLAPANPSLVRGEVGGRPATSTAGADRSAAGPAGGCRGTAACPTTSLSCPNSP